MAGAGWWLSSPFLLASAPQRQGRIWLQHTVGLLPERAEQARMQPRLQRPGRTAASVLADPCRSPHLARRRPMGAMTTALCNVLERQPILSCASLLGELRAELRRGRFDQIPSLTSSQ
ncbi:unnamed protein product, partial [Prorocentrum cordatum]